MEFLCEMLGESLVHFSICVLITLGVLGVLFVAYLYVQDKLTAPVNITWGSNHNYFWRQDVDGPEPTMIFGTRSRYIKNFLGDVDIADKKRYGDFFGTYDGLIPNFIICNPDTIGNFLCESAKYFQNSRVAATQNPILRSSLLSLCGEEDRAIRNLIPEEKIETLLPRLEASVNSFVQNIEKTLQDNKQLTLNSVVTDFIYDVTALVVFGVDLNGEATFKQEYLKNARQAFSLKAGIIRLIINPISPIESQVLPEKTVEYFSTLVKSMIKENSKVTASVEGKTVIDLLIEAAEQEITLVKTEKDNESVNAILTDDVIVSKCISTLLTLVNSTRTTVLLSLHALAQHQHVQDKLFNEIEKIDKSDKLLYTDLERATYLDMVLAEVLRLYPSEFRLEKICKDETKIENVHIEKGVKVSIPLFALHRSEEHYSDPETFDPEHFSQEATKQRHRFAYLPFGQAGSNGANISIQLGILASKLTIYKLVKKFRFKKVDNEEKPLFNTGVTLVPVPADIDVIVEGRST